MPKKYFEETVKPTFADSQAEGHNCIRRCKQTAEALNNAVERLAHQYWQAKNPGTKLARQDIAAFRDNFAQQCPEYAIVRDMADAEKHIELTRASRRLTRDEQTKEVFTGGSFGNGFSLTSFNVATLDNVVVSCDDGARHNAGHLLSVVYTIIEKQV